MINVVLIAGARVSTLLSQKNMENGKDENMTGSIGPGFEQLRWQAEEILRNKGEKAEVAAHGMLALIQELEVHRVELEVQNEELRQARRELEESRRAYSDLYNFAPVGYVSLGKEGTIVTANLTASRMLGCSKERLLGRGFSRFVHPEDHTDYFGLVREACETRGVKRSGELRLIGHKTAPFYARVELSGPMAGGDGPTDLRIVFVDISEQKNSEEKLRKYAEKLERSNQELQDFAFIAAHDLNEPLRKIQAFGERLQKKFASALGEEGLEHVERIRGATKRLQDMTRGLLDYSRITAAGAGFVPVDLGPLVRGVLADLEWQIEKSGAQVSLEGLPTLEADPDQMRRLFQNLISNALKFTGKEPALIRIFSRVHGLTEDEIEYQQICVEDNGIGFDQSQAERIFSLFERLHSRSAFEGSGMGLAICRRIVERHGGSLTAHGAPAKGAIFTITLPVKQQ
jgi:PAS domain S-box-containing protein